MSDSASSANTCLQCGATIATGAPEGLCPRCVVALNLCADTVFTAEAEAQPAPAPWEIAAHFPHLEVIELLGRGGMGVVYKARQKALGRLVALKLLAPERVADPKFAERFAHEAKALAALNHPSIVTIHDFGQAGGFFYLLMEYVDGVNLRQAMKAGRFTPEQALGIVPPVCDALQYAHEHGIVHRDIKPENLLLDREGRIRIADFGIAKIIGAESSIGLAESQPAGTPQYMAPEQKEHRRTDHRADIYSLGVVLYELLTGELPADKLQPPSHRVQVDVRLDEIVLRALEKTPELRYQTAGEMRTQVETFTSSTRNSRAYEAPSGETDQSLLTLAATKGGGQILKTGNCTFATPERFSTFAGQIFHWRMRGQIILDDQKLTLSRAVEHTVIPLAAIRDMSIGQYPRTMNPVGLDLISLSYEQNGQRWQLLLSQMDGVSGLPATWNDRVAEWYEAIRRAVQTATGRLPATTPREQLSKLSSAPGVLLMITAPLVGVAVFAMIMGIHHQPGQPWDWLRFIPLLGVLVGGGIIWLMWLVSVLFQKRRKLIAFTLAAVVAAGALMIVLRGKPYAEAYSGQSSEPLSGSAAEINHLRLKRAEQKLADATKLKNDNLISQEELDQAKFEVDLLNAESAGNAVEASFLRLKRAEQKLARLTATKLRNDDVVSQETLDQAKFEVDLLNAESARNAVEARFLRLKRAEQKLARLTATKLRNDNAISQEEIDQAAAEVELARVGSAGHPVPGEGGTVREHLLKDSAFMLYTVVFSFTIDADAKPTDFKLSKIFNPRSTTTDAVNVDLPQAYFDEARKRAEIRMYSPRLQGATPIEKFTCFSFSPSFPTVVITDLDKPLDKQP